MKRIHMSMLRRALTVRYYGYGEGKDKLPRDMECILDNIHVYGRNPREPIGLFTVKVNKGSVGMRLGNSPHRVFILIDGRWVPAGRVAQIK